MAKEKNSSLSYNEATSSDWLEKVEGWGWEKVGRGIFRIEGKCPRCKHQISTDREFITTISFLQEYEFDEPLNRLLEAALPPKVWVRCNCAIIHPDGSKGDGCGQSGEIAFANNIKSFDRSDFRQDIQYT
jgi:hypothetical protein